MKRSAAQGNRARFSLILLPDQFCYSRNSAVELNLEIDGGHIELLPYAVQCDSWNGLQSTAAQSIRPLRPERCR